MLVVRYMPMFMVMHYMPTFFKLFMHYMRIVIFICSICWSITCLVLIVVLVLVWMFADGRNYCNLWWWNKDDAQHDYLVLLFFWNSFLYICFPFLIFLDKACLSCRLYGGDGFFAVWVRGNCCSGGCVLVMLVVGCWFCYDGSGIYAAMFWLLKRRS